MGGHTFKPTPLTDIIEPRRREARKPVPWRGFPGERKPLWAILGEEAPYGWRPPEVRVPLAPPGPHDEGIVRLTAAQEADTRNDTGVGRFVDDLAEGAKSCFRGIGRAGDQIFDSIGATNAQD